MKIKNTISVVDKARVADLTVIKNNQVKFLEKNLKAYAKVASQMKKADKKYVKAKEAFGNEDNKPNEYYLKVARNALNECVNEYNVLTQNINSAIDAVKVAYENHNAALAVVDPEKAALHADDFHHYNNKIGDKINKIKTGLAGYPHY